MKKKLLIIVLGLLIVGMPKMSEARRVGHRGGHGHGHWHHGGRRWGGHGHWRRSGWGWYGRRHWYGGYWWPAYWNSGIYLTWGFPRYAEARNWNAIIDKLESEIADLQEQVDELQAQSGYEDRIQNLQEKIDKYEADLDLARRRKG